MEYIISGFIYVGREVLEIVFLTYLIMGSLTITTPIILSGIAGLIAGVGGGYVLGELLEPYEWATYGVLALLMLYLFYNSRNILVFLDQSHTYLSRCPTSPIFHGRVILYFASVR